MSGDYDIKTGVSLYSFQEEYFLRRMDLEGAVRTAAELGAYGVESLAEQMMPGFPHLSEEFYATWHRWMQEYGTTPTAHDMFLDVKRYKDRELTHDEMVDSIKRDIIHAEKIGAPVIRVIVNTPPEVVEAAAPFAREHHVILALEIHSPWTWDHPWIQEHIAVADRAGLDAVGVIPDMGIFVQRFPRVITERHLRDGGTPELIEHIVDTYDNGGDLEALQIEVAERGGNDADLRLAQMVTHFRNLDPQSLVTYGRYIRHVHGKFYEMTDEGEEYSIPYPKIIAALKEAGFKGWISSEYEGNRHIQDAFEVDCIGQVDRHQKMMRQLIESN